MKSIETVLAAIAALAISVPAHAQSAADQPYGTRSYVGATSVVYGSAGQYAQTPTATAPQAGAGVRSGFITSDEDGGAEGSLSVAYLPASATLLGDATLLGHDGAYTGGLTGHWTPDAAQVLLHFLGGTVGDNNGRVHGTLFVGGNIDYAHPDFEGTMLGGSLRIRQKLTDYGLELSGLAEAGVITNILTPSQQAGGEVILGGYFRGGVELGWALAPHLELGLKGEIECEDVTKTVTSTVGDASASYELQRNAGSGGLSVSGAF